MVKLNPDQNRRLLNFESAYNRYREKKATIDAELKAQKERELSGLLRDASVAVNEALLTNVPKSQIKAAMRNSNWNALQELIAIAADDVKRDEVIAENEEVKGLPVFERIEDRDGMPQFHVVASAEGLEFRTWKVYGGQWFVSKRSAIKGTESEAMSLIHTTRLHEDLDAAIEESDDE